MVHGWLWETLNWLSLPVIALVAGILLWRKLHREYPLFFWYLIFTNLATGIRFAVQFKMPGIYSYTYWVSDLVIGILTFLATYELFIRRLFPQFHKIRFYRYLFPSAASGIITLGWLMALASKNKGGAFLVADRVLCSVLVGMLVFFVSLMLFMGRRWTKFDFAISFGFGLNTATFLIATAVFMRTHSVAADQLSLIAFDVSCFVWLYCVATGTPIRATQTPTLDPETIYQARTWESMLKEWLSTGKGRR